MDQPLDKDLAAPAALGRAQRIDDAQARYVEIVKATFPRGMRLSGLRVVIDCANGAAYKVAPEALYELGAEIFPIGVSPDGFNINREVGSTDPRALKDAVLKYRADIGIALDGDADRVVLVDEKGQTIDGDQLMALIAQAWKQSGALSKPGIVATVMSNLGLERFLKKLDLKMERTAVGDRYVVEVMRAKGYNVGGEQSGHIVLSDFSTTGDGLLAALQVLAVRVATGKPVSEICHLFDPVPQILESVQVKKGGKPLEREDVKSAIKVAEQLLGSKGRILVRASGTEPVVRVMAEGDDEKLVREAVGGIAEAVREAARAA
jgi:phosphoglucosamine mutase